MKIRSIHRLRRVREAARNGTKLWLVSDVDGVFTDGKFGWAADGSKLFKMFGPDDGDAIRELNTTHHVHVVLISGDKLGEDIMRSRAHHMGLDFNIVPGNRDKRYSWIARHTVPGVMMFIGDGPNDDLALRSVDFSFAPANASPKAKAAADVVLKASGGDRAVAEACEFIKRRILDVK